MCQKLGVQRSIQSSLVFSKPTAVIDGSQIVGIPRDKCYVSAMGMKGRCLTWPRCDWEGFREKQKRRDSSACRVAKDENETSQGLV